MECLVTKLKGTVDDSSLTKLGELRLSFDKLDSGFTQSTQRVSFTSLVGDVTLSLTGDAYFTDSTGAENNGKQFVVDNETPLYLYISNGAGELSVTSKYNLNRARIELSGRNTKVLNGLNDLRFSKDLNVLSFSNCISDFELNDIAGLTELTFISFDNSEKTTGDLSALQKLTKLEQLSLINDDKITGDVSSLKDFVNVKSVQLTNCGNVSGDIASFGNCTHLTFLSVSGTKVSGDVSSVRSPLETFTISTGLTGTIESFVRNQREIGRTTGTCVCGSGGWGNITLNGNKMTDKTVSWTETQISCGDVTITA